MLYAINHTNRSRLWCGPAAIAAVTGFDTETIHRTARAVTGRKSLMGMSYGNVVATLHALGVDASLHRMVKPYVTFAQWLKTNREHLSKPYIVVVGNHYVVVQGRYFIDNHTKDKVLLKDAPRRRARVAARLRIDSVGGATSIPPKGTGGSNPGYSAARRLAAKHGIEIERVSGGWMVWPPTGFDDERDPYEGDHHADDKDEVVTMVNRYVELL